jgi:ferredoxin
MHRQGLRQNLVGIMPDKMRRRPLDERGYPVPWFVAWINGKPDLRVMDPAKHQLALDRRCCWICGQALGKFATFVVGPMCIVNRTSAEPPSHMDCAKFAVRACPFLSIPTAHYREAKRPDNTVSNPGMQTHNPQVMALWTCAEWHPFTAMVDGHVGTLVTFGDPSRVSFWREGRQATAREVQDALYRALPILQAEAEREGGTAPAQLAQRLDAALFWFPDAAMETA